MLESNDSVTLLNGAITASENGSAVEVNDFNGVLAYLNVTAISGTSPSMTVALQDSPDGVTWYNAAQFTAVTAVGTQRLVVANVGKYVRASVTLSGTTPSFTTNVQVVGIR